jgi:SAM-dependent methyltransferase
VILIGVGGNVRQICGASKHGIPQITMTISRTQRELEWQEHQPARRRALDRILYDPPAFDSVVDMAFTFLQPQPGERGLDLGGGEGKETVRLAELSACVVSVDLSHAQLTRARAHLANSASSHVDFVQADAAHLPFAQGVFRLIYGKAILHHLDLNAVQSEVQRVLSPGGRAAFAEPLAHAPLFSLMRRVTPPWRSHDEHPLTYAETIQFARTFAYREGQYKFLTAPLAYPTRVVSERAFRFVHARLDRLDDWLMRYLPPLKRLAWYGVILIASPEEANCIGTE